jgi:hypothetical protein
MTTITNQMMIIDPQIHDFKKRYFFKLAVATKTFSIIPLKYGSWYIDDRDTNETRINELFTGDPLVRSILTDNVNTILANRRTVMFTNILNNTYQELVNFLDGQLRLVEGFDYKYTLNDYDGRSIFDPRRIIKESGPILFNLRLKV